MKKSITIIFGVMGLMFGLVFSTTKIKASELSSVTDLTYYTWVAKEEISSDYPYTEHSFNVNFMSNGNNYSFFYFSKDKTFLERIEYGSTSVWQYGSWANEAYKTVQFTGGNDVTNTTFISWLQLNGTLTEPNPYDVGFMDGVSSVYYDGFGGFINPDTNQPYDETYSYPYNTGYNAGLASKDDYSFTGILFQVFNGLGALFTIELLPNITLGAIIAVPIVFGIIYFILGKRSGN